MSLFSIYVPRDYFNVSHDALRMVCIQVVVQFLFSVVNGQENPFFSMVFFQTISFVIMGVLFYWLVLSYVINIKTDDMTAGSGIDPTVHEHAPSYSPATHHPSNELWQNEDKHEPKRNHKKASMLPPIEKDLNEDEGESNAFVQSPANDGADDDVFTAAVDSIPTPNGEN